jgi:hypothetical protein
VNYQVTDSKGSIVCEIQKERLFEKGKGASTDVDAAINNLDRGL